MENNEIKFIHVSKNIRGNPSILLLPIGLVGLADFFKQNGYNSEILHLELEKSLDSKFDLINYLKSNNGNIFCFDLHWHYQSNKVIETVKRIKKEIPNSYIILGGFTASFFAEEILKKFKQVDFVIKGDAEIPLLNLIKELKAGRDDFKLIPNLVWKQNGDVITNKQSFVISQEIINKIRFSNFKLIKHYQRYNRFHLNQKCLDCRKKCDKIFYYSCGKGCSVNCSFCGGSCLAQKNINNRNKPVFISHDSVIKDLKNTVSLGINTWYSSFDPYPNGDYYLKLFKRIRKEKLNLAIQFESWSFPTKKFIDEFVKTFDQEKSLIGISPESGSDSVRKKNKGYFYTNKQLINTLKYASSKKVNIWLYFTAGLPFEKKSDIMETLAMVNFMRNNFDNIRINNSFIELEPASPLFIQRRKYGILSNRRNFNDYYKIHKKRSNAGYRTKYLSESEIESANRLIRAESICYREKSLILESLVSFNKYNFNELFNLCNSCNNFKKCFSDNFVFF